ncbi:uncharacterized protein LOC123305333 isoform X1 [Chrysoperla carnea]|uniref:uncharacterized protein LOC123305333 isoform X1 n=1 Tax=Chrysoperla carnea TaxID=189513 RepID=UPI001D06FBA6|nr:uncharacterized protein LOC123305333 isoform X1 [Chrysoperla carnea]
MFIIKKMIKFKHVLLTFFLLITVDCLTADNHLENITTNDSCQDVCSEIHLFSYSRKHLRPVCERGCRLFNIIKRDNLMVLIAKNQCHTSCSESYPDKNNLEYYYACITGCDFMADKHFIEGNIDTGENTPSIKKYEPFKNHIQHESKFDDSYYRISDTHIKTIPIGHFNNDDILPGIDSDNLTLNERMKDWLIYSIHNPIVQKFACFLVTEIVIILLLYRICVPYTSSSKQDALYVSDTQPILLFQISTNQNANI